MTALTPGTDPPRRRATDRQLPARMWNWVRGFLTLHVRMWVVGIAAVIVTVLIWAVAVNQSALDRRLRDSDRDRALTAAYAADIRAYDNALRDRQDCLADVARSLLNRGQHEANVKAYEQLLPLTPPAYQIGIQMIIDALRAGPLLKSPPRSEGECPPVPVAPVPPGDV